MLIAVCSLAVVVVGGLVGVYVVSQTNDVSSEMSNAQVANELQSLRGEVRALSADLKSSLTTNTTQDGRIDTVIDDIADLRSANKEHEIAHKDLRAMIEKNEKDQRDYNFNLKSELINAQKAGR